MNKNIIFYTVLSLIVLSIQVLVLNRIDLGFDQFSYIQLMLYPYLIMILPYYNNKYVNLLFAFGLGILVDIFSGTLGIHASATVFIAFLRPYLLSMIEPKEGYIKDTMPSIRGQGISLIFLQVSILVFVHHLFLFSVEAFSFVYLTEIILKTIFSFIVSTVIIMLAFLINNPK